jgi:endonuclease G
MYFRRISILIIQISFSLSFYTLNAFAQHLHDVSLKDNGHMLLGNPSKAVYNTSIAQNYLIQKPYYSLSYNHHKRTANWVSWHLDQNDIGYSDRQNNFRADDALLSNWYHVKASDYKKSGFDRGHLCPSADRTSSSTANSSTFLMSNMIPEAPKHNRQTWAQLERFTRDLVADGNEVYVIMGCYGIGGTGSKGYRKTIISGNIQVPARIWKVLVVLPKGNQDLKRINTKTRVIAVDTPNNNTINSNWRLYLTSVDAIEKVTGYDLLNRVSIDVQKVLEGKVGR